MFSLTICFGPIGSMWQLMYRTKEAAEAAEKRISFASEIAPILEDDFGQRACINGMHVHGYMLEDMSLSKLAHIERALHHARTQAEGTQAAQTDATLRSARAAQGGPAIIDPMGMGRGNGRVF